jgi:polyribonucleotide nucleotidyltransferase
MASLRAAFPLFVLAAAALALTLAGCGGSSADLLPGKTANQINSNLDQVRSLVAEGDCAGAESAVSEVKGEVENLGGVDKKLKAALVQGTNRLGEVVISCGEEAEAEAEKEAEAELADQEAEQEQQEAVEAEEEELAAEDEKEEKAEEKAEKKAEKEAEKEEPEGKDGAEEVPPPEDEEGPETGKGPPEVTPGGTEPPAGGVSPGAQAE